MKVGIEALGIAVPPTYVAMEELAKARGVEPSKYLEGIGTSSMAVALPDEDTVTLAARAAKMALESAGVSPNDIALLAVGTETAVDHSKPVASYVQSLVGVGRQCRVFETKHACYGGTAAAMPHTFGMRPIACSKRCGRPLPSGSAVIFTSKSPILNSPAWTIGAVRPDC